MPEFPCDTPITLAVKARHGAVEVFAEPRTTASVEVTTLSGALPEARVELVGDVLSVDIPESLGSWLSWRSSRLRIVARIPTGSRVEAKLQSSDLVAHGSYERIGVGTGSGDVSIEHVTGDAEISSGSGDLRVDRVDGTFRTRTGSGDIDVRHVGGDLSVRTASGDLTLGVLAGSVDAITASGDVDLGVASAGQVSVRSASGDVTVGVATGTGVWLDLATTSGDTRNELALQDDVKPPATEGPALAIKIRTISGDIKIRRAMLTQA